MLVQINTDKNIEGYSRMNDFFSGEIKKELDRFDSKVTRVEVHLGDENSDKFGTNDKRCLIEVRVEGKNPIAVTTHSNTIEKAFYEGVVKIKRSLDNTLEKMRGH
ncbi:HPF/RaiA family ribosome-associated protein [Flavobacterium sp.]|uniref:HPF/RaiA family ribosome-associated protein n=1 Tax=Flavobacterium sp. TaxID=239 RepID=UPI003D2A750E